jgi:F0F1-type ATP synthase assembly protein I
MILEVKSNLIDYLTGCEKKGNRREKLLKKITKGDIEVTKYITLLGQTGLTMIVSIILGLLAGLWLDSKFSSQPLCLAIFTLLGIGGGFVGVYKLIVRFYNFNEKSEAEMKDIGNDNS